MDYSMVIGGLIGGGVGAAAAYQLQVWRKNAAMRELEAWNEVLDRRLVSLENTLKSAKGVAAREEKSAEWENAMAEALPILQEEGEWGDKLKKLAPLAAKYPAVRAVLMKQLGVGF